MSLLRRMMKPDAVRPRSSWIERVGLPVASSVMLAQPIGLAVALLMLLVAQTPTASSIPIGQSALLLLGLLWWAMLVEHLSRTRRWRKAVITLLHILGWLLALILAVGPHLLPLLKGQDILDVVLAVLLVTWFWRRGMHYALLGFEYGDLATAFKISLGFLLVLLLIAVPIPQAQGVLAALEGVFPLFFLSGIVSLSLARLSRIRATRGPDGFQADPSRAWLLALTALGGIILALVMLVNAFFSFNSFEWLLGLLTPVWNALGTLISWLLYGIIFLLTPLFDLSSFLFGLLAHTSASQAAQSVHAGRSPLQGPQGPHTLPPELVTIGRWVFLALLFLLVLLVLRKTVQRWFRRDEETPVEEERETVDVRSALRERWQNWRDQHSRRRRAAHLLEALDPASLRARYRELLRAVAEADTTLARHPDETPHEYEERLVRHLNVHHEQDAASDSRPTTPEMLREVTEAYARERYGLEPVDDQLRTRIIAWIPDVILHITGKTTRTAPQRLRHRAQREQHTR